MSIRCLDGKFVIDGKETFLYGGEMHYFRIPREAWEQRLDLLLEAGCNLVSTYIPWCWHEPQEGKVDLNGETRAERDLVSFLELVRKKGLFCIVRPGPYVMAEIRLEGIPPWLLETYPEVVAKTREGKDHPTRVVTYRHPVFLEKVKRWYHRVNQVISPMQIDRGGPVILYQLCNEIGMLHWVSNTSDFHPYVMACFSEYLDDKYGSPERIQEPWGVSVSSFSDLVERFKRGWPEDVPPIYDEWRRFWRQYFRDYVGQLREMARATGITVPFLINVHGFKDYSVYSRGKDYPIGLSQLCRTGEFSDVILAGDFYPGHIGYDQYHDLVLACALTKSISRPEQPLFSAEFQSGRLSDRPRLYPQDLDLNTRTCVAHGMNALNYYMFVAGENPEGLGLFGRRHEWQAPVDSKGQTRPAYEKAKHLGQVFQTIGSRMIGAKKRVHTWIGFQPDDYMTEVMDEREKSRLEEWEFKRDSFAFDGVWRLLTTANLHFEAIDLSRRWNVRQVPSLWVFSGQRMNEDVQKRLVEYVSQGGKLILFPEIPLFDRKGRPCRYLSDRLDLGKWEVVSGIDTVTVMEMDSVMVRQRLHWTELPEGTEPIAFADRGGNKEVAAIRKSFGQGEVLVLGLGMGHDYAYQVEVIRKVAGKMRIVPHLVSDNPHLSLVERSNGKESFLFVQNYDEVEQTARIYKEDKACFDGEPITVPPRSGLIALLNYRLAEDLVIDYATVELTRLKREGERLELMAVPIGSSGMIRIKPTDAWRSPNFLDDWKQKISSPQKWVFEYRGMRGE